MNEVELAQKMIMNFFQGTLKNDFTPEQKNIENGISKSKYRVWSYE